jgi:hypothetical protein
MLLGLGDDRYRGRQRLRSRALGLHPLQRAELAQEHAVLGLQSVRDPHASSPREL